MKQLELSTGSVAVGQIGRIVIFYRPSLSKLKAVEKKKQARKVFLQRKLRMRPTSEVRANLSCFLTLAESSLIFHYIQDATMNSLYTSGFIHISEIFLLSLGKREGTKRILGHSPWG